MLDWKVTYLEVLPKAGTLQPTNEGEFSTPDTTPPCLLSCPGSRESLTCSGGQGPLMFVPNPQLCNLSLGDFFYSQGFSGHLCT